MVADMVRIAQSWAEEGDNSRCGHAVATRCRIARKGAIDQTGAHVQFVSGKLDVFASFFALNGLEGVLSVCDR